MANWVGAIVAGAVLNGICQGLILTALVWLALRAAPRTPAATRYGVWLLALLFIVAMPFAGFLVPVAGGTASEVAVAAPASAQIILPAQSPWTLWVLAVWAAVTLLLMARLAWSFFSLQGIKARAMVPEGRAQEVFAEVQRSLGGNRDAALLASDEIGVPLAAGLRKPAVLLPAFLVNHLSEAELRDVLTHELAHLRRWDDWANLAQRMVEAVLFFHPAVLWIGRRLRLERELACDDQVVAVAGATRPYAACLTKLAALAPAAGPQLAPGAVSRKPQISIRVEALLAKTRNGTARFSRAALALAAAALAVAGIAALPVAPVGIAEPPVPALAVRTTTAPVPDIAYAVPRPPAPRIRTAPRQRLARVERRPTALDAPLEQAMLAPPQAREEVTCYVVWLRDSESGWIQVLWWHTTRSRVVLNHA